MNWLIIPIVELKKFDKEWDTRRKNVSGTEAILHESIYNNIATSEIVSDYPFTLVDDSELNTLLNTKEWYNDIKL